MVIALSVLRSFATPRTQRYSIFSFRRSALPSGVCRPTTHLKLIFAEPSVVARSYHPSTQEAEAGESWIQGQPSYIVRPCLKKINFCDGVRQLISHACLSKLLQNHLLKAFSSQVKCRGTCPNVQMTLWVQWLMPVILATQEAEIRRIMAEGWPRQKVSKTPSHYPTNKRLDMVSHACHLS
jgi:hypothetical protein